MQDSIILLDSGMTDLRKGFKRMRMTCYQPLIENDFKNMIGWFKVVNTKISAYWVWKAQENLIS